MEFVEKGREARGELEDEHMLAAEALAGLSRYSSVRRQGERQPNQQIFAESQDQGMDAKQFSSDTAATVAAPMNNTKNVEAVIGQTCSTSGRSKVCRTLKQNLTEAEKEARRLSRILANRESARRTIRHRQHIPASCVVGYMNHSNLNVVVKRKRKFMHLEIETGECTSNLSLQMSFWEGKRCGKQQPRHKRINFRSTHVFSVYIILCIANIKSHLKYTK